MRALIKDVISKPLVRWRVSANFADPSSPPITNFHIGLEFDVCYGSVQEVLIARVPFVQGEGRSFAGFGRSHVTTELVKEISFWLKDHQTGQEKRFDLGEVDLPTRAGHDLTLLWVNRQLYAIYNHTTRETRYFELHPSVAPFRKERFRGFAFVLVVLLGVPFFGFLALPLVLGLCAYPLLAALGRPELWTAKVLDPYIAAVIPPMITALMIFTAAIIFLYYRKVRTYNSALHRELERQISAAMAKYVFGYGGGRPI